MHETQEMALRYLVGYIDENGFAPSRREMAKDIDVTLSHAHWLIQRLEEQGFLVTKANASRAVHVTGLGRAALVAAEDGAPDVHIHEEGLRALLELAVAYERFDERVASFIRYCYEANAHLPPVDDLEEYVAERKRLIEDD